MSLRLACSYSLLTLLVLVVFPLAAQTALPQIAAGGVLNAADYGSVISPGSMVSIFGTDLAPETALATTTPLPTRLQGVSVLVTVNGQMVEAPLFFVSAGQINAQMPYGIGGQQATIRVRTNEGQSGAERITVQNVSPRFYTKTMNGLGEALLLHYPDYTMVGQAAPARPEEVVILYMAGLGEVNPEVPAGTPAGNGGNLGPLNSAMGAVEVLVNGQQATVLWAGLAPGFAGLYQVNLIMPATLPAGMSEIVVRCGGGQTQASVTVATIDEAVEPLAPEDVVRLSLEAQVAGDIDKMFSYWALEEYEAADVADGRAALTLLRNNATFTNFEFTPLATGYGDQGNLAIVRAEVSFTMAVSGIATNETEGIFAMLVGGEGEWKILSIDPDDLQNMVIYDRQLESVPAKQLLARRYEGLRTPAQASADLNYTIVNTAANEGKMAADGIMTRVGAIPGTGDAAAVVYQAGCVGYDTCQSIDEYKKNGFSTVFFLNLSQAAIGIVQIVVEPIPGVDTAADMVQMFLERTASMHELRNGVKELAAAVRQPQQNYNAYLFLPTTKQWERPDGLEESLYGDVEVAFGRPPQGIALTKRACIDKPIPFVIVGEVPVPSGLEKIAEKLGAKKVGAEWKLPLDITTLGLDDDMSEGEFVLQSFRIQKGPKGMGLVAAWKSTCVRGFQTLKVPLANGEIAFGPEVKNKYMNYVQQLNVTELQEGKLEVGVDQLKSFKVVGEGLPDTGTIDLSTSFECLPMWMDDASVASLDRTPNRLGVKGEAAGTTNLNLKLPGPTSKLADQFPDVEMVVPVQVGDAVGGSSWSRTRNFLFYNNKWNASFSASVTTTGQLVGCESKEASSFLTLTCYIPPADSDPPEVDTYTITTSISDVYTVNPNDLPGEKYEQVVYGQFDSDAKIEGGKDGGTFVKTLQVPHGKGQYRVSFSVIVYYKHKEDKEEPRWKAGEMLFLFYIRR